jgi:hypothetical protein
MTKVMLPAVIALATLTVGCASSANLVRKDTGGGRVSLQGAYMPSMADARLLMAEHCQGPVDAVELGKSLEFRCRSHGAFPEPRQELAAKHADSAF